MKTYYLEEIDFADIIKRLDDVEEWQIYINSWWWSTRKFDTLLTRLEEKKNKWAKIKLRWIFIWSWAFHMFYKYSWDKCIEYWCDWIIHTEAWTYTINSWIIRWDKTEKQRYKDLVPTEPYKFLTKKEKERFRNWEDIYLNYERLQSIFNNTTP
jgi:hypothetical protein